MKILVVGGMHGNEPLGLKIVKLFKEYPIKDNDVDTLFANEQAIARNRRYIKNDLNRAFPGKSRSKDYEIRRAAELTALAKRYDLVLDFHNTHCPDNDCGFVGEATCQLVYDAAAWFGLRRIIVADYDCINKYVSNCLSVEVSLGSQNMDVQWWYNQIVKLASLNKLPAAKNVEKYRFIYRMTLKDSKKLNLSQQNLKAFQPVDKKIANKMGVSAPAYPIFIGDNYTPYNYGGLLNRLD